MNKQRKVALTAALCTLAGLAVALPSSAQTFTTDLTQDSGSPFGTGASPYSTTAGSGSQANNEYQQYYNAARFSGPGSVSSVTFNSSVNSDAGAASYNITAMLGTTTRQISDVSAAFINTTGFTTVFTGTVKGNLSASDSPDLTVNFTNPYLYNTNAGNLVLDIVITSASLTPNGTALFDAGLSTNTNSIYRVFDTTTQTYLTRSGTSAANNTRNSSGMRTTFGFSPTAVPEPSQTAAFAIGAAGLLAMVAFKRRRATQC